MRIVCSGDEGLVLTVRDAVYAFEVRTHCVCVSISLEGHELRRLGRHGPCPRQEDDPRLYMLKNKYIVRVFVSILQSNP